MRKSVVNSILAAAFVVIAAASMTFAKTNEVSLMYKGMIGNHLTLKPGNYKIMINNNSKNPEVAFYQGKKLVGQVPVKLVAEQKKADQTAIYYSAPRNNIRKVTEIELSGWNEKLVFPGSKETTKSD
jgi:hypothetical protein